MEELLKLISDAEARAAAFPSDDFNEILVRTIDCQNGHLVGYEETLFSVPSDINSTMVTVLCHECGVIVEN